MGGRLLAGFISKYRELGRSDVKIGRIRDASRLSSRPQRNRYWKPLSVTVRTSATMRCTATFFGLRARGIGSASPTGGQR